MKFAEPIWLLAGLAVCVLLPLLYRRFDARQRKALASFASPHLLVQLTTSISRNRRSIKRSLFVLGIAFIFTALARPQWGFRWEETRRRGIDILFAVDTSNSMLAQDVKPNRLARAKLAVTDLVNKLGGDRVGLIAFAGSAFLQSPLTLDYDAFQQSLDALDTNVIPVPGTDVAAAIQAAEDAFGKEEKNVKILVLITDGEDLEARGIETAKTAAKDGLKVYTIGVGNAGGELIPVPSENGGTEFLKDDEGKYVKSRLDETVLRQIAEATGGMYQPLGQRGEGLDTVYKEALAPLPKQELASRMQKVFFERFQWPLALGLVCLFAEMLIGTRRSRAVHRFDPVAAAPTRGRLRPSATALIAASAIIAGSLQASPQSAERAYKKGDYENAEKQYEESAKQNPQAAELQYNLGAASYKTGDLDKSLSAFQKTLQTDKLDVQEQAYYNMGNAHYRQGQQSLKEKPDEAIKAWKNAVQCYDSALKLKPDDADGKYNRDLVQRKLDKLQKQQQQNQQSQDQDKDNKDNKDQKDQQQKDSKDSKSDSTPSEKKDQQEGKQDQAKQDQAQQKDAKEQQQQQAKKDDQKSEESKTADASKKDDEKKDGKEKSAAQQQAAKDKDKDKPDQDPGDAKAIADNKKDQKPDDGEAQQIVGQMSRQEAQALLNSLRKDERAMPATVEMKPQNSLPKKHW